MGFSEDPEEKVHYVWPLSGLGPGEWISYSSVRPDRLPCRGLRPSWGSPLPHSASAGFSSTDSARSTLAADGPWDVGARLAPESVGTSAKTKEGEEWSHHPSPSGSRRGRARPNHLRPDLPEERECQSWLLIRLREHRSTSLLQNTDTRQFCCFGCYVDVADAAFSSSEVLTRNRQVVNRNHKS